MLSTRRIAGSKPVRADPAAGVTDAGIVVETGLNPVSI
jgi:hypothetical protein